MSLIRPGGLASLLTICAVYPYLPGAYDRLAVPLSLVAQVVSLAWLPLVPVAAWWLWLVRRGGTEGTAPGLDAVWSGRFRRAAVVWGGLVAAIASVVAWASGGLVFGGVVAGSGVLIVLRYGRRASAPVASDRHVDLAWSVCLTTVPLVAVVVQGLLAGPLTDWSRRRAIASGARLVGDLEAYHVRQGRYPQSMHAVWPDYKASVIGIEGFHYLADGETYNLSFEQPVPLMSAPGTREFVVFNPRGDHLMLSHAAWHLTRPPEALADRPGWYDVRDAAPPGWKRFRFD